MTDRMKKTEDETRLKGAVEIKEEHLDEASGGAVDAFIWFEQTASLTSSPAAASSLNFTKPAGVKIIGEEG